MAEKYPPLAEIKKLVLTKTLPMKGNGPAWGDGAGVVIGIGCRLCKSDISTIEQLLFRCLLLEEKWTLAAIPCDYTRTLVIGKTMRKRHILDYQFSKQDRTIHSDGKNV